MSVSSEPPNDNRRLVEVRLPPSPSVPSFPDDVLATALDPRPIDPLRIDQAAYTPTRPSRAPSLPPAAAPAVAASSARTHKSIPPHSAAAHRLERAVATGTVTLPWLGVFGAIAWHWRHPVLGSDLALFTGFYLFSMIGISGGFHRLFTHRAFGAGRLVSGLLGVGGSMAAQGPLLFWVSVHRRHHSASDLEDDPHSPCRHPGLAGLWHAHVGWMLNHAPEDWTRFTRDLLRDRWAFGIHRHYALWVSLGFVLPALLGAALTASWEGAVSGLLWGGFLRVLASHHTTWSINSICHRYGSQPLHSRDDSRNNAICALLTVGEGWHNNHHAFQGSAKFGLEWWQPDATYALVRVLELVGLVHDVRTPTAAAIKRARARASSPDFDLERQDADTGNEPDGGAS